MADNSDKSEKTEKKDNNAPQLKRSWFKGLKVEFKKITWPDKKRVARETFAVVVSAVILAGVTLGVDVLLELGLQNIWS